MLAKLLRTRFCVGATDDALCPEDVGCDFAVPRKAVLGWWPIGSELIDALHGLALHLLNPGRILLAILPMAEASPGRMIIL